MRVNGQFKSIFPDLERNGICASPEGNQCRNYKGRIIRLMMFVNQRNLNYCKRSIELIVKYLKGNIHCMKV